MRLLLCVICTLLSCLLAAEKKFSPIESLSGYGSLLDGCIDPVSGTWNDHEVDLKIPGSSLSVDRVHSSAEPGWLSSYSGFWEQNSRPPLNQWSRWGWNHSTLFYYLPAQKLVYIQSTGGNHLSFSHDCQRNGEIRKEIFRGWNNLHSVNQGARGDSHNYKLSCPVGNCWKVITPQGIVREFSSCAFSDGKLYYQTWMCAEKERIYPSGIRWRYSHGWPGHPRLDCMNMTCVEELDREGSIIQSLQFENRGTKVSSSTGQWVEYSRVFKQGYPHLLTGLKRSDGPALTYEYICPDVRIIVDRDEDGESYFHHHLPPYVTKNLMRAVSTG